ncbi:hypothetical protein HanOQP8_Chr11g0425641 [Helianthus annuus]|nr:hypothetical protein HanOQP8_Chr11g0425641 [Helianthus annuus]
MFPCKKLRWFIVIMSPPSTYPTILCSINEQSISKLTFILFVKKSVLATFECFMFRLQINMLTSLPRAFQGTYFSPFAPV